MNSDTKTNDKVRVNSDETIFKQMKEEKLMKPAMRKKMNQETEQSFSGIKFEYNMVKQRFFVAHLNYHLAPPKVEDVVPAEFAILEFSLEYGVTRSFHRLINSEVKQDFYVDARKHSEKTHKLFFHKIGVTSKMELYYDIIEFMTDHYKKMRIPVIYAMPNNKGLNNNHGALTGFLTHLQDFVRKLEKVKSDHIFRVYSLPTLLWVLYNGLVDTYAPELDNISISYAHKLLHGRYKRLGGGTFCEFHNKDENLHCSQSKVVRCAFLIFEHTLPLANVKPIRGHHLPGPDMKDTMRKITMKIPLRKYYHPHQREWRMDRFVTAQH